ncbi:MAG: DUF3798 domain-containing protein [Clostridiales bacterium]|nr:DUF3798 domain-containing protein [Clostridiales bacterium]
MKKRFVFLVLVLFLLLPLVACEKTEELEPKPGQEDEIILETKEEPANNYKIAFCTLRFFDDEEANLCAEKALDMYGSERIQHFQGKYYGFVAQENINPGYISVAVKPEPFSAPTKEEVIAHYLSMVKDPDIKVVIANQNHFAAGVFEAIRKIRPDILLIAITPGETDTISQFADIVMQTDELAMGRTIPRQAKKLGAKTLVHYSFPRHMDISILARQREIMEGICREIGLEFIYIEVPDPMDDGGFSVTYQFILDDITKKVAEYGPDTCFFSTYYGMQETLILAALEQKAIVAQQCEPGPYVGYSRALGIEGPWYKAGDVQWINEQIHSRLAEGKYEVYDWHSWVKTGEVEIPIGTGRFSSWPVPPAMVMGIAAIEYGLAFIEGKVDIGANRDLLQECLQKSMAAYGYGSYLAYLATHEEFGNYFLITEDYITY